MSTVTMETVQKPAAWRRLRKWVAGGAAAALLAGTFVYAGIGIQSALAAVVAPNVSTGASDAPLVAGEDIAITVSFSNPSSAPAGDDLGLYNLSGGLVIPEGVIVPGNNFDRLGAPAATYTSADGALPGAYNLTPEQCEAMGLEAALVAGKCQVPVGMQYLVFMNISDLPAGASNSASLTLRADAELFEPGSEIPFTFSGFTSFDANLNPVFPGSTSVSLTGTHSSAPGVSSSTIPVEALRITKSEPSEEQELLRGVHENQTVYTLTVRHTNQGNIGAVGGAGDIRVVDYLPASLEYLGSGLVDNTLNANGNVGEIEEYPGSGPLDVSGSAPADWQLEESIETVLLDATEAAGLGLAPGVYTKVTWNLGELLADPAFAQDYPSAAGTSSTITIQYRAGIPLFENTMDFVGGAPSPESLGQGANLDNNTGPSTRHGRQDDPWTARGLVNAAFVSGDYERLHPLDPDFPDDLTHTSEARGSESVDAVDVRLLKSVNQSFFQQNGVALYTLDIATSEYVEASLGSGDDGEPPVVRPNRLVDDLGDGICPVFPADVAITPGASTQPGNIPNLVIGNPNPGHTATYNMSVADWVNSPGFPAECAWPSAIAGATLHASDGDDAQLPDGTSLTGIAYNPDNGHFYLDLWFAAMGPNETVRVNYSALQMSNYNHVGGAGGTSSGDLVRNDAELLMTTTPAPNTDGNEPVGQSVGGEMKAFDDSSEDLQATTSEMKKYVLPRDEGPQDADGIVNPALTWEDIQAPTPFIIGDEVWYKITLSPPTNIEVRNPVLDDILPVGTKIAPVPGAGPGGSALERTLVLGENYVVKSSSLSGAGQCDPEADEASWIAKYVQTPAQLAAGSNRITWNLGSSSVCAAGTSGDRFLPVNSNLEFYFKLVVTDSAAFGTVDNPQNLAKYRQEGLIAETTTEIFFERDDALAEVVSGARLVKGIAANEFAGIPASEFPLAEGWAGDGSGVHSNCEASSATAPAYPGGSGTGAPPFGSVHPSDYNVFGSDCDGEFAVQGDQITFRLDVTAPLGNSIASVPTSDYLIWDALPEGVTKDDIIAGSESATSYRRWVQNIATPGDPDFWQPYVEEEPLAPAGFTFTMLDPSDGAAYTDLNLTPAYDGRTIIVWNVTEQIPGSVAAATDDPGTEVTHGFSLYYTLTVPDGTGGDEALLLQEYENTASIVEFGAVNSTTAATSATLVPFGPDTMRDNGATDDALIAAGKYPVPTTSTIDDSGFQLPNAAMRKWLYTTEIRNDDTTNPNDPGNNFDQVVQGEHITYRYTARIPANTTVREGVLFDEGELLRTAGGGLSPNPMHYKFVSASFIDAPSNTQTVSSDPGSHDSVDFVFNSASGKLFFPEYYQTGSSYQDITVQIVVWVDAVDETHTTQTIDRPTIGNNTVLENTAKFQSKNLDDSANELSATEDVAYVEPLPSLSKGVTGMLGADGVVTFTLGAGNASGRPALYDAVVYDCLPPGFSQPGAGWNAVPSLGAVTFPGGGCDVTVGASAADNRVTFPGGPGTLIQWSIPRLDGGQSATLTFDAQVDDAAGGGASYTNRAHIVGYTLPTGGALGDTTDRRGDRATGAERDVPIARATIAKGVSPTSAPVGETVTYTVTTTIPANANFYDAQVIDTLPTGLEYVAGQTPVVTFPNGPAITNDLHVSGQTITWPATAGGAAPIRIDIPTYPTDSRTITIQFQARITDSVASTAPNNTARFFWNIEDGVDSTRTQTDLANRNITLLNPNVIVEKRVKVQGADDSSYAQTKVDDPDQQFTYRVRITNNGNTPAHHIEVSDIVDPGVKIDTAALTSSLPSGITAAYSNEANLQNGLGGTITFTIDGPLTNLTAGNANRVDLTYHGEFVDSEELRAAANGTGVRLDNDVKVEEYYSFDTGGWQYRPGAVGKPGTRPGGSAIPTANTTDWAGVTPQFPLVSLAKAAADTTRNAYVGEPFEWVLTATNTGVGAAQKIVLTDTLPENWEFDAVTSVTINGVVQSPIPQPADPDSSTLVWTFGADADAAGSPTAILPAGQSIVIRFTAIPIDPDALTDPGFGSGNPHVNTLSAVTTDRQNSTHSRNSDGTADRSHTGPNASDNAFLREADLHLEKNAIGGVTDPTLFGDLPADTWIAGQNATTGYAQPRWQILVTNQGDDPAFGPFVITDTPPTPAGVTVGIWTARYHSGSGDTVGTVIGTFPWDAGSFTIELPLATPSLAIDGSNWISLTADVTIAANALSENAGSLTLNNTASVLGKTYETPENIDKDNEDSVSKDVEELADLEVRKQITAPTSGVISVGESITFTIDARNNGPSVSRGDAITLTDTVPAGLSGVTVTDRLDWMVTAINGTPATVSDPIVAGDTITWTYQGDPLAVGAIWTAGVTITGTIDRSFTGELVNWAQVHPDETLDPDYVATPGDPGYGEQNNRDDARITPNDDTTVSIVKTRVVWDDGLDDWRQADPSTYPGDEFVAGEPVHYRLTVTNATDRADARAVTIVDESPEGLSYTGHAGLDSSTWGRIAGGSNLDGQSESRWNTFTLTSPATLTNGASAGLVVSYDTATTITGDVINWAEVTIENWDRTDEPEDRRDRDDDSTGATRIVDLGIEKSHDSGAPLTPGTEVTYTLVVENYGVSATNGVIEVVDDLPVGLSYVAGSATAVVSSGLVIPPASQVPAVVGSDGPRLTWSLLGTSEVLDAGETVTITYRALIDQKVPANTPLKNEVTVEGPDDATEPDPDPHPNEDEDTITTGARSADMEIEKTVAGTEWIAGQTVSYTLTISNGGPSAVPAEVLDTLPSGLTMVSMSGTDWDCSTVGEGDTSGSCVYTSNDGLHPAGTSASPATSTITVVALIDPSVATGTSLTNEVVLTWVDNGTKTDEDDVPIIVTTLADLVLTKTAINSTGAEITSAVAGETARYSLSVFNDGPSDVVAPITVVDTLPSGVSFVQLISAGWTAEADTPAAGQVTFTRDPATSGLAAGATAPEIVFEVQLDASLPVTDPADPDDDLVNTATVTSGTPEVDTDDNTDTAPLDVTRSSNVSIVKGHTPAAPVDEFELGDEVEFTLDVANASTGPSNASGIVVTDTLPEGLEFVSISGTDWSLAAPVPPATNPTVNPDGTTTVVVVYANELAPGASAPRLTITAEVTVDIGDNTSVTNEACVAIASDETNTVADPCDTDSITTVPLADLVILKTFDPALPVSAGQPVAWSIAVGNLGLSNSLSSTGSPIVVTDTVPDGISGVADPSQSQWTALLNGAPWPASVTAAEGDVITWVFEDGGVIPAGTNPRPGADPDADPANPFVTLRLEGTLDSAWIDGDPVTNTADVAPGVTRDPNPGPDSNESSVTETPDDDVTQMRIGKTRVVKNDDGDWVEATENFVPGDDISYRITVVNDGPAVARDVVVVDETPLGLAYGHHESISGVWDYTAGGTTSAYPGGPDPALHGDEFGTFTLDGRQGVGAANAREFVVTYTTDPAMQHTPTDPLTNWAELTAGNWVDGNGDPEHDRDFDDASSTRSADLVLVKTHTAPAAGQNAIAGETVDYRLVVTNLGPSVSDQPILVADTLPSSFSYVADSASISVDGAPAVPVEPDIIIGQDLTWSDVTDGVDLIVGGTVAITFTALIDRDLAPIEGVENAAVVDGPNDNNILNDRDTDPVDIAGVANLTIDKAAVTDPADITAGEPVTWLLTPRNLGPSVSISTVERPITVNDTLPAGIDRLVSDPSNASWIASTSNPGGWLEATAGDTITWTFVGEHFLVGAEPDIAITAIIDAAWHGGDIVNTAALTPGPTPDPELPNEGTSTVTPGDRTGLEVWKNRMVQVEGEWVPAASLDPVPPFTPGADVTYRLSVANDGPAVARDVQLVDPIPSGFSNPRITNLEGQGNWTAETVACEHGIADLAGYPATDCLTLSLEGDLLVGLGEMRSLLVTFASDPALDYDAEIVNWVQARAANVPEDERPNDEESTIGVPGADLSIVKTALEGEVLAGGTIDYRLLITNHGPSISRGPVTVTDQLPIGLGYVPGSAVVTWSDGTVLGIDPTITGSLGSELLTWVPVRLGEELAPGETVVIELQTQLATGVFSPAGLVNTARVDGPDDYEPGNNESDATVIVEPLVTLITTKTAVGEFQVGGTGRYEVTVENFGPTADPGPITVTDALPNGLSFNSAPVQSNGITFEVQGQTLTWTLPHGLAVGEKVALTFVVNVHQAAYPLVTNTVTVDSPTEKTPDSVLIANATVTVKEAPPLEPTGGEIAGGLLAAIALMLVLGSAAYLSGRKRTKPRHYAA